MGSPRGSFEGQGLQDNLLQAQNSGKQADIAGDGLASKVNVHSVLKSGKRCYGQQEELLFCPQTEKGDVSSGHDT